MPRTPDPALVARERFIVGCRHIVAGRVDGRMRALRHLVFDLGRREGGGGVSRRWRWLADVPRSPRAEGALVNSPASSRGAARQVMSGARVLKPDQSRPLNATHDE